MNPFFLARRILTTLWVRIRLTTLSLLTVALVPIVYLHKSQFLFGIGFLVAMTFSLTILVTGLIEIVLQKREKDLPQLSGIIVAICIQAIILLGLPLIGPTMNTLLLLLRAAIVMVLFGFSVFIVSGRPAIEFASLSLLRNFVEILFYAAYELLLITHEKILKIGFVKARVSEKVRGKIEYALQTVRTYREVIKTKRMSMG